MILSSSQNIGERFRNNKNIQQIENAIEFFNVASYHFFWSTMVTSLLMCSTVFFLTHIYFVEIDVGAVVNEIKTFSSFILVTILCLLLW